MLSRKSIKMDLLEPIEYYKTIPTSKVVKSMWGRIVSLKYYIPGGYIISWLSPSLKYPYETIKKKVNDANFYRSRWEQRPLIHLFDILNVYDLRTSNPDLKLRTEGSNITFYFYTEDEAEKFATETFVDHINKLQLIKKPAAGTEHILLDGKEIKRRIDFKYKIQFHYTVVSKEAKQQVYNYISALDKTEVKYSSAFTKEMNESPYNFIFNNQHIYINDLELLTFINLINPKLVSKIIPIHKLEQ